MRFKLKLGNQSPVWWPLDKETKDLFVSEFVQDLSGSSRNKAYLEGIEISSEHKVKNLIRDGDTIEIREGKSNRRPRTLRFKTSRLNRLEEDEEDEKCYYGDYDEAFGEEYYDEEYYYENSFDKYKKTNFVSPENLNGQSHMAESPVVSAGQSRCKNINRSAIESQYSDIKVIVPPYPFPRAPIKRYGQAEGDSMTSTGHDGKITLAPDSSEDMPMLESSMSFKSKKLDGGIENSDSPPNEDPIKMVSSTNFYQTIGSGSGPAGSSSQRRGPVPASSKSLVTSLAPSALTTLSASPTSNNGLSPTPLAKSSKELFGKIPPENEFQSLSSLKSHQVFVVWESVCKPYTQQYRTIKFHGPIPNGYLIQTDKIDMSKPKSKGKLKIDEEEDATTSLTEEEKRVEKLTKQFGYEKLTSDSIGQSMRLVGEDNTNRGIKITISGIECPIDYFTFYK